MGGLLRTSILGLAVAWIGLQSQPVFAQTLEDVAAKADEAALAGHNAWMLTSCALVLFMTAPGLAMFYGGLVRKKNVLGVMMQCLFLMGLMTVICGHCTDTRSASAKAGLTLATATTSSWKACNALGMRTPAHLSSQWQATFRVTRTCYSKACFSSLRPR